MDGAIAAVVTFIILIVAVVAGMFIFTVFAEGEAEKTRDEHNAKKGIA